MEALDKLITKLGVLRLKDLIKAIRACKTAADERQVIAKESAFIRTSFKEENVETRHINVAKLLYIHMLGYPAHFGQMECLKLVASPKFADKRLGYLGIMLLLDENQEVLTLVTNCLKNDMNNPNMYIVGLALCTLGNISSQEMARDLSGEVEKLLGNSNSYIRKKAALCALRVIRKVPDLMENFLNRAKSLLNERNHGVLLTGTTLLTEMCQYSPAATADVRKLVPALVRHLKNLVTAGFSPEHDVSGVTDPFLQVKVLRLLRILGKGDAEASDAMNDVLAQVATSTEGSKNVGNSILYEAVLTIMDIESDSSLRVLGVNILGRFLANRDNNIRYVALTTLTKACQTTQSVDAAALQRHRATILDCLRDPDVSIRRRALDLVFFLINSQNIRILTRELLSYLEVAEGDVKSSISSRICEFAGRYRPNKRWEVDTVCRVLRVAGSYVDQNVVNHFVKLVTTGPADLSQYTVRKLYNTIRIEGERALAQEGLVQAMVWTVGEFGDALVNGTAVLVMDDADDSGTSLENTNELQMAPSERDVLDMFTSLMRGPYATPIVKEYAITAMAKLSGRFQQSDTTDAIKLLIEKYRTNFDFEIQQRAVEYTNLFALDHDTRIALLERMPVLESATREEAAKGTGVALAADPASPTAGSPPSKINGATNDLLSLSGGSSSRPGDDLLNSLLTNNTPSISSRGPAASTKSDNVMDLLGGISLGGAPAPAQTTPSMMAPSSMRPATTDLLGDIFGGGSSGSNSLSSTGMSGMPGMSPMSSTSSPSSKQQQQSIDPLAGLFGPTPTPSSAPSRPIITAMPVAPVAAMASPSLATRQDYICYDKSGLKITLSPTKDAMGMNVDVGVVFANTSIATISAMVFQVAVPKSLRLQMQPPSSTVLPPGSSATQQMRIENPTKAAIRLRLKVSFQANGAVAADEIVEFSGFPASLWA
ncbi:hypothetical protein SmJEL517_g02482 [Synchytrium microbalum]|uniref:AP-1 complex subunit gamma n=1 Tax=Synchytrium microbalum TaxID=1806994 RepID=A0A507CAU5_9FUNG|nr:uncharacterized protein SmJEL517_g02482 [Synchytrium microbalum]TPX35074.1 hypothetical protein SmJEL517_g02482 [Synchytrium microbalum]